MEWRIWSEIWVDGQLFHKRVVILIKRRLMVIFMFMHCHMHYQNY